MLKILTLLNFVAFLTSMTQYTVCYKTMFFKKNQFYTETILSIYMSEYRTLEKYGKKHKKKNVFNTWLNHYSNFFLY